jgi:hypothetical protein
LFFLAFLLHRFLPLIIVTTKEPFQINRLLTNTLYSEHDVLPSETRGQSRGLPSLPFTKSLLHPTMMRFGIGRSVISFHCPAFCPATSTPSSLSELIRATHNRYPQPRELTRSHSQHTNQIRHKNEASPFMLRKHDTQDPPERIFREGALRYTFGQIASSMCWRLDSATSRPPSLTDVSLYCIYINKPSHIDKNASLLFNTMHLGQTVAGVTEEERQGVRQQ